MREFISGVLPPDVKSRLKGFLRIPDMEFSLQRLSRVGFRPKVTLDIGANAGDWSRMCRRTDNGFRPYDFCSAMRRPLDDALFPTDMLFVRQVSPIIASKRWR